MSYLHINNLYKDTTILMFKECYALEKIHGTSAHLTWKFKENRLQYSSGGENGFAFMGLFNHKFLVLKFQELFPASNVKVFGEAYGGKLLKMRQTYGEELKFVVFEVQVEDHWLNVPNAEDVTQKLGLEFVSYEKISTELSEIDNQLNIPSVQAQRNGINEPKIREGVVLRPLVELTLNNGSRVIAKHKRPEFQETNTPREVNQERLQIIEDADKIAEEWVTEMRLTHVLQNFESPYSKNQIKAVLAAMVDDIFREASGEIQESQEAKRSISKLTAKLFLNRIENE